MSHAGVDWGGSCRGGQWWIIQGWGGSYRGGSCRGAVGHTGVRWGSCKDGVGHVGWDALCRGGVGHAGVGWVM